MTLSQNELIVPMCYPAHIPITDILFLKSIFIYYYNKYSLFFSPRSRVCYLSLRHTPSLLLMYIRKTGWLYESALTVFSRRAYVIKVVTFADFTYGDRQRFITTIIWHLTLDSVCKHARGMNYFLPIPFFFNEI